MIHINIDSSIFKTSLDHLRPYDNNFIWFHKDAGKEHYRLLANISAQLPANSVVIDLGTAQGHSALALASNPEVKVVSYDIADVTKIVEKMMQLPNIQFVTKNGLDDAKYFANCPVIMLDIDPHDGLQERDCITRLIHNGYRGIVICDDIHLNDGMKSFWDWVSLPKYDVSKYGHWSGTGIIIFDPTNVSVTVS